MKRVFLFFSALLVSFSATAGEIVTDSVKSEILGATVKYNVYLPEGFDESDGKYPVVYLLHGLWGGYTDWKNLGGMQSVADELIESGEACDMVIVMPNAGSRDVENDWSGYFNMPGWSYEDFFFKEFIPSVESKYRAIGDKEHRAVMGLSMGGGGSTVYCQRHPDMFSSCYAMSAWLDNKDMQISPSATKNKLYYVCASVSEFSALDFLDNADKDTIEKLKTVKWFFDCGDDDGLLELSFRIHMKMMEAGIPDQFRVMNGAHNWEYWHLALRRALPFATRNFSK